MLNIEERIRTQQNLTLHEIEVWYQSKKSQGSELLLDTTEALSFWCGAIRNMEWLIVELYKRKLDQPTELDQNISVLFHLPNS